MSTSTPATIDLTEQDDWIPEDTFGARLAVLRARKRWNVLRAATTCDLDASSWTNWERGLSSPQDYEGVCIKIAKATRCNLQWLMSGGPMPVRSKWSTLSALRLLPGGQSGPLKMSQMALPLFASGVDN